jgi:hypothetical protein
MADEILCTRFQAELLVHSLHAVLVQIDTLDVLSNTYQRGYLDEKHTLVGSGIVVFPALQELEELLSAALLKEAHQGAPNSLHLRTRDLGDASIAIDEAARDLLELEITSDVGVDEDLGQLS